MSESARTEVRPPPVALRRGLVLLGLLAWTVLLCTEQVSTVALSARHLGTDFQTAYWEAAREVAAGNSPYAWFAVGRHLHGEYMYAPLLAVLLAPLTRLLDYAAALAAWLVFSVACLVWGAALAWRLAGLRWTGPGAVPLLLVLPLVPVISGGIAWGRVSTQLLLAIAAAGVALAAGRSVYAGAWLALGAYIKSFPALLGGFLLLRRQWTAAVAAVAAGLALVLVTVAVLGWEDHWLYLTGVVPSQRYLFGIPSNASFTGVFTRLLVENPFTTPVVVADALGQALIALTSVALVAATAYAVWHVPARRDAEIAAYGLAVTTTMLVAPINSIDHLTIALLPLAIVGARAQADWPRHGRWLVATMVLLSLPVDFYDLWPVQYVYVTTFPEVPAQEWPWRVSWGTLLTTGPILGLLLLWALLFRLCQEHAAAPPPQDDASGSRGRSIAGSKSPAVSGAAPRS